MPLGPRRSRPCSLVALAALGGCGGSDRAPVPVDPGTDRATGAVATPGAPRDPRGDVLLITLDTTRADHLSFMGASPVPTPALDGLAAEGAAFHTAITPAPITLVAHASLMTGLLPRHHGVHGNGIDRLSAGQQTLAEQLSGAGYSTAAFVGAAVLDARYGLDQGFDLYDDSGPGWERAGVGGYAERPALSVVESALAWRARQGDGPCLLWVHLFDAHAPYHPPEPERSTWAADPYSGEIAYVDRAVGTLLDGYRAQGRLDDALVVVAADHGEGLGEHGELSHGFFLYDSTLHVPLIVRLPGEGRGEGPPGAAAGVAITEQVSLVDVAPTVLAAVGLPIPPGLDGRDLGPLMRGESDAAGDAVVFAETRLPVDSYGWAGSEAVRTPTHKLIVGTETELYELASDPAELHDVSAARPAVVDALSGALAALRDSTAATEERLDVDDDTRAALQALGYIVADDDAAGAGSDFGLSDPRKLLPLLPRANAAYEWFELGLVERALEQSRALLDAAGGDAWFRDQLVDMLLVAGRMDEAAALLPDGRRDPRVDAIAAARGGRSWPQAEPSQDACVAALASGVDSSSHLVAATCLLQAGRATEARELLRGDVEVTTVDPPLLALLSQACDASGDRVCARWAGLRARAQGVDLPSAGTATTLDASAAASVARARRLLDAGQAAAAQAVLAPLYSRLGPLPDAALPLAEARIRQGHVDAAHAAVAQVALGLPGIGLVEGELAPDPHAAAAAARVGDACWAAGDKVGAAQAWLLAGAWAPQDAGLRFNTGLALERLGRPDAALAAFEAALARDPTLEPARRHQEALRAALAEAGSHSFDRP